MINLGNSIEYKLYNIRVYDQLNLRLAAERGRHAQSGIPFEQLYRRVSRDLRYDQYR